MKKVYKILTEQNLSKTTVRVEILSALLNYKKPMSIFDFKKIKSLDKFNESSIYRNLKVFEKLGIIKSTPSSNDYQSYEIVTKGNHHHHHVVCNNCGELQCLSVCKIDDELKKMTANFNFKIEGHSLEIYGTCKNCT